MVLHAVAASQVQISVTLRPINRLRKAWGLNRGKGRPRRAGSQSTTLRQFLGHWERLEAAAALRPALLPATARQRASVDGPRSAYWARVAMPKGTSTMLGRIRAGSQAVIAHNEVGQALFVTY